MEDGWELHGGAGPMRDRWVAMSKKPGEGWYRLSGAFDEQKHAGYASGAFKRRCKEGVARTETVEGVMPRPPAFWKVPSRSYRAGGVT